MKMYWRLFILSCITVIASANDIPGKESVADNDLYRAIRDCNNPWDKPLERAEKAINDGASVRTPGRLFLHGAVFALNPDMTSLLVKHGANVDEQDGKGRAPLMYVAHRCHYNTNIVSATLHVLLAAGANLALKDNEGLTALDHARNSPTSAGRSLVVKTLYRAQNLSNYPWWKKKLIELGWR